MVTIREPLLQPTPIAELRPTQITVGMREVHAKQKRWKEQDGKLCYTQTSKPIPGRPTYFCAKGMDGKKVGDTWIERGWSDGRWYKGRVVAGSN